MAGSQRLFLRKEKKGKGGQEEAGLMEGLHEQNVMYTQTKTDLGETHAERGCADLVLLSLSRRSVAPKARCGPLSPQGPSPRGSEVRRMRGSGPCSRGKAVMTFLCSQSEQAQM